MASKRVRMCRSHIWSHWGIRCCSRLIWVRKRSFRKRYFPCILGCSRLIWVRKRPSRKRYLPCILGCSHLIWVRKRPFRRRYLPCILGCSRLIWVRKRPFRKRYLPCIRGYISMDRCNWVRIASIGTVPKCISFRTRICRTRRRIRHCRIPCPDTASGSTTNRHLPIHCIHTKTPAVPIPLKCYASSSST